MKKMKVYDVYLDDGDNCFKVTVPSENENNAKEYCAGNGEIIACRLNPNFENININALVSTLKNTDWKQLEIDVITRCLRQCGLAREID